MQQLIDQILLIELNLHDFERRRLQSCPAYQQYLNAAKEQFSVAVQQSFPDAATQIPPAALAATLEISKPIKMH